MQRLLIYLLVLIGCLMAGCGQSEPRRDRDARLSNGQPQVEVTVEQ